MAIVIVAVSGAHGLRKRNLWVHRTSRSAESGKRYGRRRRSDGDAAWPASHSDRTLGKHCVRVTHDIEYRCGTSCEATSRTSVDEIKSGFIWVHRQGAGCEPDAGGNLADLCWLLRGGCIEDPNAALRARNTRGWLSATVGGIESRSILVERKALWIH